MDRMIKSDWRKELIHQVHGKVLEVGIGTGANIPFYRPGVEVIGIDFSKGMLKQAHKKLEMLEKQKNVKLLEMDAQALQFPDDSFDFVISTCVYCSVPDPIQGFQEIRRVCKPNGKILMLEHMRSENPVIGSLMDISNPLVVRLWGANINRRTLDNIHKAGLEIERNEMLIGTIMRKLILKPNK